MDGAVLLVHDGQAVRVSARKALAAAGYDVAEAVDVPTALQVAGRTRPCLIFLPWLGRRPVREALSELRAADPTRRSRIIVWAEQNEIGDAAMALELGADDCLALPFDAAELVARVNACLRRPLAAMRPDELTAGPLLLDKAMHRLTIHGREVALSPAEFRLLAFLLENQGRVFSREELLRGAWPKNISAGGRTVDVHVRRLRQLLEPFHCDDIIQTVRSFGYRLAVPARDARGSAELPDVSTHSTQL
ncbi:MAG TPA: winged helix-turn-helix domain-containing protein [Gammaproteobacteria bacterium]|nr:winged helix-turn-helix domain-containing protein [Gammaproteobacteria bacterium]